MKNSYKKGGSTNGHPRKTQTMNEKHEKNPKIKRLGINSSAPHGDTPNG